MVNPDTLFDVISRSLKVDYPDNNPKTIHGLKKISTHLVPPSAILSVAEVFALGAKKYGPYNWRERMVSSSVYYAAAMRHLMQWWDGEDLDPESGQSHLGHAIACMSILIDGASISKLNDDRPPKGAASKIINAAIKKEVTLDPFADNS